MVFGARGVCDCVYDFALSSWIGGLRPDPLLLRERVREGGNTLDPENAIGGRLELVCVCVCVSDCGCG